MLVLAHVFYKERTVFLDMAYNLFYIIKDKTFCLQLYRFGDMISQLPPIAARNAGLPIGAIFRFYSDGFILFYFTAYIICGSVLKRYDFALVLLLLNMLFAADTFYWMVSQLPQAIALLIIVFALISGRTFGSISAARWAILLTLFVTVIFYHPLIVFVLGFSLVFFALGNNPIADRKMIYALAIIYVSVMLFKVLVFKTPYEAHSMSGMKNFITQFPDYFTLFSNRRFLANCLTKYYWIPVFFFGIVVFYAKTGDRRKLWFFVSAFLAYFFLVDITYPTAVTPEFYIENVYLPLAIFLALPFVFDLLPLLDQKKIAAPLIVLVIVTGCFRVYATHPLYTARLDHERRILDAYGDRKVLLQATQADADTLLMLWGTPFEFLLLSESERNKPASIIIDKDAKKLMWAHDLRNGLLVNWNVYLYKDMPAQYYQFTDTVSTYNLVADPSL